jgi:hypothetical protein
MFSGHRWAKEMNEQDNYKHEFDERVANLWLAVSRLAQFVELDDDLEPIVQRIQMLIDDDLVSLR